jgi:hypothetical protein
MTFTPDVDERRHHIATCLSIEVQLPTESRRVFHRSQRVNGTRPPLAGDARCSPRWPSSRGSRAVPKTCAIAYAGMRSPSGPQFG